MADDLNSIELATELTIAWLGNHNTRVHADDVLTFLQSMHVAVNGLTQSDVPEPEPEPQAEPEYKAAVTARKSLASPEHIISMIDGKRYRTLRRHLSSNGLTPAEYRTRYGLKADYPIVAPAYSESRRAMAHKIGLGRKAEQVVEEAPEEVAPLAEKPVKRARKSVAEAKQAAQAHLGGNGVTAVPSNSEPA